MGGIYTPASTKWVVYSVCLVRPCVRASEQFPEHISHVFSETLGDLWKGEGWVREHGLNKMYTTGTFRTLHDRELLGRKAGNLKEVGLGWINGGRKDRGFGWGTRRSGGEQLF